jgi:hypothetical protein
MDGHYLGDMATVVKVPFHVYGLLHELTQVLQLGSVFPFQQP